MLYTFLGFEQLFQRIASGLKRSEMKPLSRKLGLSQIDLRDIELTYDGNFWRQKLEIFRRWKSIYRDYATKERLKRALQEVRTPTSGSDETNQLKATRRRRIG